MLMKPTYKFSIVSAVYNTAEYLEEMIQSVINQDIGFEENVQLILVNDGSSDGSAEICKSYQKKYPKNIKYVGKEHGGVSHTRNQGIQLIQGWLVNFLDSDDKLEKDALSKVWIFYQKHKTEIDVVAIPIYLFEGEEGEHILNDKFFRDRVIKIQEEPSSILLSSSSSFINRAALEGHKFDETLQYAEDAKLLAEVILHKGTYGVVSSTKYWYRKRKGCTSAVQNGHRKKEWYLDYIKNFSLQLLQGDIKEEFRAYIRYLVMYDLQWRINSLEKAKTILTIKELREYIHLLSKVLKYIDSKCILNQKYISIKRKLLVIILKYSFL